MIYSFVLFLNFLFFLFFETISKKINLFDYPDNIRKVHKNKVTSIGGFLILSNFFLYYFLRDVELSFKNALFPLTAFFFFFIGYLDDRFNLGAFTKLILMIFVVLTLILIDNNLLLKTLQFSFIKKNFLLNYSTSILITIFCFIVFVNAFNFFDGINLQSGLYSLFFFSFFIFKSYNVSLCIFIMIGIFFFLYFNLKKKCFLGNNGSLLLGFVISYLSIDSYNRNLFFADEIILLMLIPGIDLIRLFFLRVSKGLSPMIADKEHLHHYLISKFGLFKSIFILAILISFPNFINLTFKLKFSMYIFFINIFIYIILIYNLRKKF